MRSDYGLYIVAVICFVLAAIFATSTVPGYEITGSNAASGITVTVVFSLIGIIAAVVGYSARPKTMMSPLEPTPAPAISAPVVEATPMTEEPAEPSTPPVPTPVEMIPVSVAPAAPAPEPSEQSPPIVEMRPEPEAPPSPPVELSADVAAEEKPKPARRRRKKATA